MSKKTWLHVYYMIDKKRLSERDFCAKYITSATEQSGWDKHTQFLEEVSFTAGKVLVKGKMTRTGKQKRADYILYYKPNIPIAIITATYHNWRNKEGDYQYESGFCQAATLKEVEENNFVLTPGRYVGTEEIEDDGVSFEEKVATISAELSEQFAKSNELQERIRANLAKVGIEI